MKWNRLVSVLFLLVLGLPMAGIGLPTAGIGQEVVWTYRPDANGWIGFWYNYSKASVDGRDQIVVEVTEVAENSPAEAYGIVVGDVITHLDGQAISEKLFSSMSQALEPGDLVRLVVRRDGRPREITVEAESPPTEVIVSPNTERMVVELDALTGDILKSMDSLRVSFGGVRLNEAEGNVTLQVLRIPSDSSTDDGPVSLGFTFQQPFVGSMDLGSEAFFLDREMAFPFETLVIETGATAPLKEDLLQIRREITAVRRAEEVRRRELAAAIQGPIEEVLAQDQRMKELQARELELLSEQEELSTRLRDVSEAEMQRHWVEVQSRSEEAFVQARKAQEEAVSRARWEERNQRAEEARDQFEYTYRSPVIVGQSFFMGAQMAPLNPELAEYFPVDEGVIVVQVVEGSPAFEAGLQGGDVIITVAGEDVSSLSELRFSLSAFEGPIQIGVVRKGEPVQIVIRR